VRSLRTADGEGPARRARDVVLPALPATAGGSGGEQLVETAVAVEPPELGVAADRPVIDHDLRHGPPACEIEQPRPEARVLVDLDFVVLEPLRIEERLGTDAEAAPLRRIHANARHYLLQR